MGSRPRPRPVLLGLLALVLAALAAGCGGRESEDGGAAAAANASTGRSAEQLSGDIVVDGSSTVAPLTTAAAERFREEQPGVRVTVGTSGTGGGFEKFCNGETDISDASRQIKDEEASVCSEAGIEHSELRVATDALTVVVNAENDWVDCLTVDQLKAIWEPGSKVTSWSQVPGGDFPDEKLVLAGPGTDSGTFDYFTDEVNGEEGASRSDYTASEDDNVVVRAVQGARGGLGYLGFSYYEENQGTLKALQIDGGGGCVEPSAETAQAGEYTPLARPLFVYVKNESLARPEVRAFVEHYIRNSQAIAEDALFVPLTEEQESDALDALEATESR